MSAACIEHPGIVRFRRRFHRAAQILRSQAAKWLVTVSAAILLALASPFLLLSCILGARLRKILRTGKQGRHFNEFTLIRRNGEPFPVTGLWPRLLNLVRGEITWVGPEARLAGRLPLTSETARRIVSVEPGLLCQWRVQKRTNVAYGSQPETDLSYVESRSLRADSGIALRSLLSMAYGRAQENFAKDAEILGLPLDNISLLEAAEEILRPAPHTRQVSFINVDCVNRSCADAEYRGILQSSDLRLADGIGLRIAGRLLRSEIKQNVNGTDLFPVLCEMAAARGLRIFLLGGRPGVAADVASRMSARFPKLQFSGVRHGYFQPHEEAGVVNEINASGTDILLVAFGAPLQEKWIRRNRQRLAVRSALGVGGLFDFYSGRIPRAPQWLRELGLEWTFRLYQEPGRMWRRYLVGNVVFLARVLGEKLFGKTGSERRIQEVKSV